MRTLLSALLLSGCALSLQASATSGWIADALHPNLQYRFICNREALSIEWKSSYPGAVTLRARIKGSNYDGQEQVAIPPEGKATSNLETLYCSPESFEMTEKHFAMASPPAPTPAKSTELAKPPAPTPPTVAPWTPPAPLAELAPEALAKVHVGMQRQEVLRRIGNPISKLTIPEDNDLVERYRYPVSSGRIAVITFSNGVVTEVTAPQP